LIAAVISLSWRQVTPHRSSAYQQHPAFIRDRIDGGAAPDYATLKVVLRIAGTWIASIFAIARQRRGWG